MKTKILLLFLFVSTYSFGQIAFSTELYNEAISGKQSSQYNLALCYGEGRGVEKDYSKEMYWYNKAAEQGGSIAADAFHNIGVMYYNGEGVARDYQKVIYYWEKSFENGYARAGWKIGELYDGGKLVNQDKEKAVQWYIKAANHGYKYAQYYMGKLYENGYILEQKRQEGNKIVLSGKEYPGIEKNIKLAEKYYRDYLNFSPPDIYIDEKKVSAKIQFKLAEWYYDGKGVDKNYSYAIELLRECVDNPTDSLSMEDKGKAYFMLQSCYRFGRGISSNLVKAENYLLKAAKCGHHDAMDLAEFGAYGTFVDEAGNAIKTPLRLELIYIRTPKDNNEHIDLLKIENGKFDYLTPIKDDTEYFIEWSGGRREKLNMTRNMKVLWKDKL